MRRSIWAIVLIVTLLLAGCGPAMQPATGPETESGEVFMIALPRIVVDFDASGNPSVLGLRLADIGRFTGQNLAGFQLNKFYVDWMTAANVQHVELRQTGNGIALFVNGRPLPHVGWTDESLAKVGELTTVLNVQRTDMVSKFLPIIRRLGLDVVLTFPRQGGVAEIPLVDPTEAVMVAAAPASEPASAIVQFEIKYDENGIPGILGITASDLASMGINLGNLRLGPSALTALQANDIQSIELRGQADGMFMYINGDPLPNIVWDDAFLGNAADLYAQMNPQSPYIQVAQTVVPLINNADIGILVHFPIAEGAEAIAVKMH